MSDWIRNYIDYREGATFPRETGAVEVVAMKPSDVFWLVQAITDPNIIDTIRNFFTDFTGVINSIYLFPFQIPTTGSRKQLKLLGENVSPYMNNVGAYKIAFDYYATQHLILAPVLISPKEDTPHYYDYNGYTKIFVYLPYYGEVEIMANDVMNKYLQVSWVPSSVSGKIMYFIMVSDTSTPITNPYDRSSIRLIGKYECDVAVEVPIGATNQYAVNRNILMSAASAATTVATAAVSIGLTAANVGMSTASTTISKHTTKKQRRLSKDSRLKTVGTTDVVGSIDRTSQVPISRQVLGAAESVASSTLSALNNAVVRGHSEITKNPLLEQFACQSVKVLIYRPKLVEKYHSRYVGLPLNQIGRIGSYSGFTKVSEVHLEEFPAHITMEELTELENILTSGFIIA